MQKGFALLPYRAIHPRYLGQPRILKDKKHYENIKQKLNDRVENAFKNNHISENCYLQAIGKAPKPISKELAGHDGQTHRKNEQRRELPPTGGKIVVLNYQLGTQVAKWSP